MRRIVILASLLLLASVGAAGAVGLDSVEIDGLSVVLGMSEQELQSHLPSSMTLTAATARVPEGVTYVERHGTKWLLTRDDTAHTPLAWITFESGQITRVVRFFQSVESGTPHDSMRMLVAGFNSVFGLQKLPVVIDSGSYSRYGNSFQYLEASLGEKRLVLRSTPRVTQITEELGRRDIPVID